MKTLFLLIVYISMSIITAACSASYDHITDTPLISRDKGIAILPLEFLNDNTMILGVMWITTYISGTFKLSSMLDGSGSNKLCDGYLCKYLPRDLMSASFYTYSQRRVFVSDDPMISPIVAIKIFNDRIISVIYVTKYSLKTRYRHFQLKGLREELIDSKEYYKLDKCAIQEIDRDAAFIMGLRINSVTPIHNYSYLLIPCDKPELAYIDSHNQAHSELVDFPEYKYYYIVPLTCITNEMRLNTKRKMGYSVGRIE
jgi:hypothetical protein